MDFKDNFKRIREERHLTQEDIANEVGISRQSVSKWENGVTEPDLATIRKLCKILNCSIGELLEDEEQIVEPIPVLEEQTNKEEIDRVVALKKKNSLKIAACILFTYAALSFAIVLGLLFFTKLYAFEMSKVSGGMDPSIGLSGQFPNSSLQSISEQLARSTYGDNVVAANPNLIESVKSTILGNYTLSGSTYWYKMTGKIVVPYWALTWFCIMICTMIAGIILLTTTIKTNKLYLKQLEELEGSK